MRQWTPQELHALEARLDVRCIKWPYAFEQEPPRCGECEGCTAKAWLDSVYEGWAHA